MNITELQQSYASHPNVEGVCRLLKDNSVRHLYCGGLYASAASLFSSVLVQRATCPLVFILGDMEEAGYFYHDLTQILGTEQVLFFPSSFRRAIKYGQKDAANEILRTEVLSRLQKGEEGLCVVTYSDALAEKVVSRKELGENTLKLHAGERVDMNFVTDVLRSYGFEYVDYVYEPGQYAVRGSIIDVFSFSSEYPFRIDFFGDEVESVRTFEVETQLSKEKKESIVIVPDLSHSLEKKGSGGMVSFLDFLPSDSLLAMRDFLWLRERIQTVHDESLTPQAIAARESEENGAITLEGKLIDGGEFTLRALDFRRMEFGNKPTGTPDATVSFHTTVQPIFHKNFDMVAESFREYLSRHYTIYICSDSLKQTDRIRAIFEDRGDNISFTAVERTLHEGFADDTLRICIFTDHQLFDRFHKYNLKSDKARSGKVALSLKELNQFTPGDYVVHTDHGVGRFAGLVRIPNGDTTQEVMKIVYQNEDVVFVSIHSLHKVSKYKGKEGEAPRLNKLGTGAWEKLKDRTKTKIKDIARDLIKLYSQRREEKGFQYSPDSFLQRELEASFIYEDTPDQSKATSDVKVDMESARPMDRLVCGDVGFGKTEVAVRAAFKAVADNKQVAVLVPTTVLAYLLSGPDYPNVTWEKTTMKNIGIDFSVLKDRIWGSFDMFRNDVTNLLGYDSASPLSMTSSVPMNYGHYVRYGWDATINSLNFEIPRVFKWTSQLTLSHHNAVWKERMPNYYYEEYRIRKNEPVNAYYYYETEGVINIDKSNMPESQKSLPADAQQPGYPIIKDANGDNKITIDDVKMRNTLPKIHIGFGNTFVYKDFDLDVFMYGQFGRTRYNYAYRWALVGDVYYTSPKNSNKYVYTIWNSQTNQNGNRRGIASTKAVALPAAFSPRHFYHLSP